MLHVIHFDFQNLSGPNQWPVLRLVWLIQHEKRVIFVNSVSELGHATTKNRFLQGLGVARVALSGDWENIFLGAIFLETKTSVLRTPNLGNFLYNPTSRAARGGGGSFKNRKPIGKIRCCESRNVFVGGNSKTATAVKNLDAITECEAHDYCFAKCFQTCWCGNDLKCCLKWSCCCRSFCVA